MYTLITGNTYPVKDALKALGARWDAENKGWRIHIDRAAEARALVAGAPRRARKSSSGYDRVARQAAAATRRGGEHACRSCGGPVQTYSSGYPHYCHDCC